MTIMRDCFEKLLKHDFEVKEEWLLVVPGRGSINLDRVHRIYIKLKTAE